MYYELDNKTKNIILQLKKKCEDLALENISFSYHIPKEVNFYITKYETFWELIVKTNNNINLDLYKINANELIYNYSKGGLKTYNTNEFNVESFLKDKPEFRKELKKSREKYTKVDFYDAIYYELGDLLKTLQNYK